ncbi:HAD family hydrolase [Burkholderia cenocepacia]|uniref:hypothetical protein n=1 Tax=Burkholderia cenocepacia TaxID=95486 RepID=UPI0022377616|nr:hypothetical protein [Burkholderia cenocepacia]MCW5156378.1 hypothetical protein [Burkholderia cenocepacia]
MNVALDFDGTFTEDPEAWHVVIDLFLKRGHSVFLVTMRHPNEANRAMKDLAKKITVIFTSRQAKKKFVEEQGIKINVWIDDNPHWILEDSE